MNSPDPSIQQEIFCNSILENENYNTILIPLDNFNKNINKNIAIIYPNVLSIINYKHVIDSVISQIEPSYNIHIYKLFHQDIQQEDDDITFKKYTTKSSQYNSELIDICIPNKQNDSIDMIDDTLKRNNFEIIFSSILFDDEINEVIVFGHNNIIYEYDMTINDMIYNNNKKIIYVSFDVINEYLNSFNLYINNVFQEYNSLDDLKDIVLSNITDALTIVLPPRFKPPTSNASSILDIYTDRPIVLKYSELLNIVEDTDKKQYYCITMITKKNKYYYKLNKTGKYNELDVFPIKFKQNDGLILNLNVLGLHNLITNNSNEYLIDIIDTLSYIIGSIKIEPSNDKKILKTYNKILKKHSELLSSIKNSHIANNKIVLKTDKFNIIELLQSFVSNESFNFYNAKKQIKQNKNIIKNYASVSKCQDDVISWNTSFSNYMQFINNNNNNPEYNNSCDIYNLLLSRTSWYDELQNGNIIGLLVNITTPKLAKLGIIMDKVNIMEISNNLITLESLCEAQDIYKSNSNRYDDGRNDNLHAIYGNALGIGNSILPLYINKMHWTLAKSQLKYCLGIAINQNPFDYYNKFYEVYPILLLKLINDMISNKNKTTDKDIITFIQLTITVNKILEDVFKFSINKCSLEQLSSMFINPLNRTEKCFDNLDFILGLTMLSTNKTFSNKINDFKTQNIKNILSEELRRTFKNTHKTHIPFDRSHLNIDNLWMHYFKIKPFDNNNVNNNDNDNDSNIDIIVEILKDKYDKYISNQLNNIYENIASQPSFEYISIFNSSILDQNTINSIYKIICWSLINELNNDETIMHLNKVISNKYGNITDDTIKYFKNKFIDLSNKFNVFKMDQNKLLFLNITDNTDIRLETLILQNIVNRDKKYFEKNNNFNPLEDDIKYIKEYYLILTKPYINTFYSQLNNKFQLLYAHRIVSLIRSINYECTNYYTNIINKIEISYSDYVDDEFNINFNHSNLASSVIENTTELKNSHIHNNTKIIVDALLNNRKYNEEECQIITNELVLRGII